MGCGGREERGSRIEGLLAVQLHAPCQQPEVHSSTLINTDSDALGTIPIAKFLFREVS